MADFEDLYLNTLRQTPVPGITVQQAQIRQPRAIPAPPTGNIAGTNLLLGQMNRLGNIQRAEDQREIENARANQLADLQARLYEARVRQADTQAMATEQAALSEEERMRATTALFASEEFQSADPAQQAAMLVETNPELAKTYLSGVMRPKPVPAVQQVIGGGGPQGVELGSVPQGMVRRFVGVSPENPSGYVLEPIVGGEKPAAETTKNVAALTSAIQRNGEKLEGLLRNEDGSINAAAVARSRVPGTTENELVGRIATDMTYLKSGAGSSEQERQAAIEQIMPGAMKTLFGGDPTSGIQEAVRFAEQRRTEPRKQRSGVQRRRAAEQEGTGWNETDTGTRWRVVP